MSIRSTESVASRCWPERFLGNGLTYAAYRDVRFVLTNMTEDYTQQLADEVSRRDGSGLWLHITELDTAAHAFGIGSYQWHDAAAHVNGLLTHLTEVLPRNAVLLVTANHGVLNVPNDSSIDVNADPTSARRNTGGRRRAANALPTHSTPAPQST